MKRPKNDKFGVWEFLILTLSICVLVELALGVFIHHTGGTISKTAMPGAELNATLSTDHKTVSFKRLGIQGSLPIENTDFLEKARKAESGE